MTRRWISFDYEVTNKEFAALPVEDRQSLFKAMKAYGEVAESGFVVKDYRGGLYMLKPTNRTQGRCLFFRKVKKSDSETLVALLIYKKESLEVLRNILATAKQRLATSEEGK